MMTTATHASSTEVVIQQTQNWLERAVIGLNLCPFAKGVHAKGQIHYAVSSAVSADALLDDLRVELKALVAHDCAVRDTTLLIAPDCFQNFLGFNDFLATVERVLSDMDLDGILQIASFHPDFQFADVKADDITNFTNRAPYPTLHLLREDSISRAVQAFPQAETIYEQNMKTLQNLGHAGWAQLGLDAGRIEP